MMDALKFHQENGEIYVPDGLPIDAALRRTTHLCIAAHQDDVEIMASQPILECFRRKDAWFSAVILTDGRGSPRDGMYAEYSDEEMREVRLSEQRKAAVIGDYAALVMLDYPSSAVKDPGGIAPIDDLAALLALTRPQVLFTHNLADKHDTHIAVALKVITAVRRLPLADRPEKLLGCEVWRSLDWLLDEDKIALDLSTQENLQAALLGVYDSQISGGKRYDLAALGRRRANATFYASHSVDAVSALSFAMDLSPLLRDDLLDPSQYMQGFLQRFFSDVTSRLTRLC